MRKLFIAAFIAASALLAACGGGSSNNYTAAVIPTATPTLGPQVPLAAPVSGSPLYHVIVIIQENRTVDNLFSSSYLTGGGAYPGANVVSTWTDPVGGTHALNQIPFELPFDPDHNHQSLLGEQSLPNNLGFYGNTVSATIPSVTPPPNGFVFAQVPYFETILYHTLAAQYGLADNMFSQRLTPTFPGHLFLISGQSDPADDPLNPGQTSYNGSNPVNWGCDSPTGTTVPVFTSGEGETAAGTGPFPCFDYQTIGDLMDKGGVSWKYYTGQINNAIDAGVNVYDAIKHIRNGPDWTNNVSYPQTNIISDITNCALPNVSYVTPPGLSSDHAGSLSASGPGWVGTIYLAIALSNTLQSNPACQYYGTTAILLTWDDSGGWYDHVAPPTINGQVRGFRVPLIVASAWAKNGTPIPYVSHTQRDFGAILKFIEKNWNLGTLGVADANADDLSDMFNYGGKPVPPISATKMRSMIQATGFDLNRAKVDTTPADTQ
jgi:phospholipase C